MFTVGVLVAVAAMGFHGDAGEDDGEDREDECLDEREHELEPVEDLDDQWRRQENDYISRTSPASVLPKSLKVRLMMRMTSPKASRRPTKALISFSTMPLPLKLMNFFR